MPGSVVIDQTTKLPLPFWMERLWIPPIVGFKFIIEEAVVAEIGRKILAEVKKEEQEIFEELLTIVGEELYDTISDMDKLLKSGHHTIDLLNNIAFFKCETNDFSGRLAYKLGCNCTGKHF